MDGKMEILRILEWVQRHMWDKTVRCIILNFREYIRSINVYVMASDVDITLDGIERQHMCVSIYLFQVRILYLILYRAIILTFYMYTVYPLF